MSTPNPAEQLIQLAQLLSKLEFTSPSTMCYAVADRLRYLDGEVKQGKEMHESYMRIREMLAPDSYKTSHGGENRFEVTENALKNKLAQLAQFEGAEEAKCDTYFADGKAMITASPGARVFIVPPKPGAESDQYEYVSTACPRKCADPLADELLANGWQEVHEAFFRDDCSDNRTYRRLKAKPGAEGGAK